MPHRQRRAAQLSGAVTQLDILWSHDGHDFKIARRRPQAIAGSEPCLAQPNAIGGQLAQKQVGGSQEVGDKTRRRMAIQGFGLAALEQATVMHDTDTVAKREGLFLVVCHQDRGHAEAALHLANSVAQFNANLCVERPERFVQQQHRRFMRQGACHRHALLLPAG